MLELILFYILQKKYPGLRQPFFVCKSDGIFGARQQNFAGTGNMYDTDALKKCASKIYDAIMQVLPPPTAAAMAADAATITERLPP
jgi:hypothetical protein